MLPVPSGSRVSASSVSDSTFCIGRYAHRAGSGRLLPEATTGLGGNGLWNTSVAAGKDFLENDNADGEENVVLTKRIETKRNALSRTLDILPSARHITGLTEAGINVEHT